MAKPIMIIKTDSISAKDKLKLEKNGYLVIEHPFPGDVKIVTKMESADMDLVLKSIAEGVKKSGNAYAEECIGEALVTNIVESMKPAL